MRETIKPELTRSEAQLLAESKAMDTLILATQLRLYDEFKKCRDEPSALTVYYKFQGLKVLEQELKTQLDEVAWNERKQH